MPRDSAASKNVTDLRRSRQHARAVTRNIRDQIIEFLEDTGVQIWNKQTASPRDRAKRINEQITHLAAQQMRQDLVQWLEKRRKTSMARAARAAFMGMQQTISRSTTDADLFSSPSITHKDKALNTELKQIDAALLYQNGNSLAEEIGNEATRQIRIGFSQEEPITSHRDDVSTISQRVEEVLLDGDADTREEHGISGMTAKSRAELIAHDSVQDGYVTAAHRRYLNNGFRYGVYDAVIDTKTSHVCQRLDEVVVDMVEQPWLLPPNHPWCRSDIRPKLQLDEGEEPITEDQIGDSHLKRIWGTNGFRPKTVDADVEFNPTALNELLSASG